MKKLIAALLFALPVSLFAAGGEVPLEKANIDLADTASLQRGARLFVNYCLSCHSAAYQRYNRMGADLGLSEEQVRENLMFAGAKVGETMTIAMSQADATKWFGAPPPDLSVITRARGVDWVYTYLLTFYEDPNRPFGVNNVVFPDVGMPHVLWGLEGGVKKAVYKSETGHDGKETKVLAGFEPPVSAEYTAAARDLTAFLSYTGEPAQLKRKTIGVYVLLFLSLLFVLAYLLKKEYWKDVH